MGAGNYPGPLEDSWEGARHEEDRGEAPEYKIKAEQGNYCAKLAWFWHEVAEIYESWMVGEPSNFEILDAIGCLVHWSKEESSGPSHYFTPDIPRDIIHRMELLLENVPTFERMYGTWSVTQKGRGRPVLTATAFYVKAFKAVSRARSSRDCNH